MLPVKTIVPYREKGLFGAKRTYDIHTGLDLYCEDEEEVIAIEDGHVKEVILFTGPEVGSPWWNSTYAVAVQTLSGPVHVYGELLPAVVDHEKVTIGQTLGHVKQVLKKDKGVNPPAMLHFELWKSGYHSNFTWEYGIPKPKGLVNPLELFNFWVIKTPYGYRINTHNGQYWRHFSSAIDCKSYCMWRHDEFGEKYVYVKNPGTFT